LPTKTDDAFAPLRARLETLSAQGRALEAEGLPFPTASIRDAFEQAAQAGARDDATRIVKGGEALLAKAVQDWTWVRELLRRADELRTIAETLGVDVQHLDSRVGNPRTRLKTDPLSSGSMEKAAASASLALAVLNDAIPKFCVQEAQNLGQSIRRARDRGEDVAESTRLLGKFLQAVQDQNLALSAQRLVETRRAVSRIPRAPAMPPVSPHEEEEILREARNLARRLQRIKGKARDAQSAARLMSQVRAALSEDRRYGTPEEEIEALWLEVDRITRERKLATEGRPLAVGEEAPEEQASSPEEEVTHALEDTGRVPPAPRLRAPAPVAVDESEAAADAPASDLAAESDESEDEEEAAERRRSVAFAPYNPYIPPDIPGGNEPAGDWDGTNPRSRNRANRPRP
jgi:hypothetical protein